ARGTRRVAAGTARPRTTVATGTWTRPARRRLVDADRAAIEIRVVEPAERALGFFGRCHLHEAEAPGAPGLAVRHDGGGFHDSVPGEGGPEAVVRCGEGKTADEQLHGHWNAPFVRSLKQCCVVVSIPSARPPRRQARRGRQALWSAPSSTSQQRTCQ